MKSWLSFTVNSLGINYKKSVRRRISLADSDSQKIKENGNANQPEEKTRRKTAVAWFVSFHVAAVCAVVIQLNFSE